MTDVQLRLCVPIEKVAAALGVSEAEALAKLEQHRRDGRAELDRDGAWWLLAPLTR